MKSVHLSIPKPCHENWNQMLPEEQGKFCLNCQKTVVDFSAMSDREIIEYFSNYQGKTCGRFNNEQLNRTLSVSKSRSIGRWKYFWQIFLPAVFAVHKANAQPKLKKITHTKTFKKTIEPVTIRMMGDVAVMPEEKIVKGRITDENKLPIKNAIATLKNTKIFVVSDSSGRFKFNQNYKLPYTLVFTAPGFETREFIASDQTDCLNVEIVLSHERYEMGEVVQQKR